MKDLAKLFLIFARIGGFTFGGGYAMLPMLEREVVEKQGWITKEDLLDYYAVGQCLPGMIAVNTAIFIGYRCKKVPGAIVAAFGVVAPSIIIIMLVAAFLQNFTHVPIVKQAFAGINAAVAAIIVNAVVKMWKNSVVDAVCLCVCIASFLVSVIVGLSPIIIVLLAACTGIITKKLMKKEEDV